MSIKSPKCIFFVLKSIALIQSYFIDYMYSVYFAQIVDNELTKQIDNIIAYCATIPAPSTASLPSRPRYRLWLKASPIKSSVKLI